MSDWVDKLPVEYLIGGVAVALMLVLFCWYFLTRDEPQGKRATSGFSGALLITAGIGGLVYFFLFFDVGVGTGYGQRVTNLDLMSQRQNGIIISAVALVLGVLMQLLRKRDSEPPQSPFK